MNISYQSIHFTADQKLKDFMEAKIQKLPRYYDRIMDVKVRMKLENSGQVRDKIVEIMTVIPGETFIAVEESKTFEAAFDSSINSIKRQIKRYKEKKISKKRSA